MTAKALAKASQDGVLFVLFIDDRQRTAAHLFATKGGLAFVDGDWTEPQATGHVAHAIEGKVLSGGPDGGVLERSEGGKKVTLVPVFPNDHRHAIYREHLKRTGRTRAEDRAAAKTAIERALDVSVTA